MAVGDAYADVATYRALFSKTAESDAAIEGYLQAASELIDQELGRHFTKDVDPIARTYQFKPYTSIPRLTIADLAERPTQVSLSTSGVLTDAQYELYPSNAQFGRVSRPWYVIEIRAIAFSGQKLEITARWGWPAVPAAISQATLQLAALIRAEGPRAARSFNVGTLESRAASRQTQEIVSDLYRAYRRFGF